ncbi:DUF4442 domain-containing protein [Silvanigrella paludirubra]|jgi:acyl-coenzyme A thioesterase PaaI-like protein|uniref:DUF4442 domain-containing protein n=1 Tax=Silvanigrella paludirubra TaxID=2499159 RepID=A0A6N6VTN1_9BACT|nr:DUF4442 domain-containing protein [Silvanigrella paludirubra]KAB8039228.1 DUF4442 domain-containing protein [Silvanigrella paludirubra]
MKKFLPDFSSPSEMIQVGWEKLKKIPGGNKIFSTIVSKYIPYTGSVSPLVLSIENGQARVMLKDKRAVRNHLNCIHAIALANVGEFSTGLCLISQLPKTAMAILVKIEVEYLKKARGNLISESLFQYASTTKNNEDLRITANVLDEKNEIVTKVHATWRIRLN